MGIQIEVGKSYIDARNEMVGPFRLSSKNTVPEGALYLGPDRSGFTREYRKDGTCSQGCHPRLESEVYVVSMTAPHQVSMTPPLPREVSQPTPPSKNGYRRTVPSTSIDVYDVLEAFGVSCPARQHAIKKLLATGQRGEKSAIQDLEEARQSVERAIEMERDRSSMFHHPV